MNTNFESHQQLYNSLEPKPFGVIVVAGYMAEQKTCENDWSETLNTINVNFTGAVSILNIISNTKIRSSVNYFCIGSS